MSTKHRAGLLLLGLVWAAQSQGAITSVTNVDIMGTYDVWSDVDDNGVLVNIDNGTSALEDYLAGTAAAPGDNIELGNDRTYADWAEGDLTTLTGDLGTDLSVVITTPTRSDWTADGNRLAYSYVDAALASIGKTPADWNPFALPGPEVSFDDAVTAFIFGDNNTSGAFRLSDPNIGYIYAKEDMSPAGIKVGLQGNFDATDVLAGLFPFVGYTPDPADPVQASEVLFLSVLDDGGTVLSSGFKYGFYATRTDQYAAGCPFPPFDDRCSYTGNYEVPAPPAVALLMMGLTGLAVVRRRGAARRPETRASFTAVV